MTAEPGNEMAAAASRGHLRASHADREQVIAVLKAAFVQGRLTKDELDARVGQTFAADLRGPGRSRRRPSPGLITAPPPGKPARARARPSLGKVVAGATLIGLPPTMVAATFLTGSQPLAGASALVVVFFFMARMVVGAQMLANRHDRRSRGQLPPRRGRPLEGKQDGGIGGDCGQVRVGPRGERLAHPRIQFILGQPPLHERGLEHRDHLLAVGVRRP